MLYAAIICICTVKISKPTNDEESKPERISCTTSKCAGVQQRAIAMPTLHLAQGLLTNKQYSHVFNTIKGHKRLKHQKRRWQPSEVDNEQLKAITEAEPL